MKLMNFLTKASKTTVFGGVFFAMGLLFMTHVNRAAAADEHQEFAQLWFQGTVEQAFDAAKTTSKPVLLYWGAVWCPPCNELKAQVFMKPQFKSLISDSIAVYLDGDTEQAQAWAEKLQVTGYPTVVVFGPKGPEDERMRVAESLSIGEFTAAIDEALHGGANIDKDDPRNKVSKFQQALAAALAQNATERQWLMLAYTSWDQLREDELKSSSLLETLWRLHNESVHTKTASAEVKASFAARLLVAAANFKADEAKPEDRKKLESIAGQVKGLGPRLMAEVLANDSTVFAARTMIVGSPDRVMPFLFDFQNKASEQARLEMQKKWLAAAQSLSTSPQTSADTKLWALNPEVSFYRLEHPSKDKDKPGDLPKDLLEKIRATVAATDKAAVGVFDRHAVISGAADFLIQCNDFEGAKKLLETEQKQSDTPWYYQSGLAGLEFDRGNEKAALAWAKKARLSAKGKASRIQWIVSDLNLNAKVLKKHQEKAEGSSGKKAQPDNAAARYVAAILKEYYETAFSLSDGFSGRNATRNEAVTRNLKGLSSEKNIHAVVAAYLPKCAGLSPSQKAACEKHFSEMTKADSQAAGSK